MTGYARAQGSDERRRWVWEARSVNGRNLEIRCRVPQGFDRLENPARTAIGGRMKRGNVSLTLTIASEQQGKPLRINRALLAELAGLVEEVRKGTGAAAPTADGLLRVRGVIEEEDGAEESEEALATLDRALSGTLDEVLKALAAARAAEGRALAVVIDRHVGEIEELCKRAADRASAQVGTVRARFESQLAELLERAPPLSEERFAQEVALLVGKADVREELDRLAAHIAQARDPAGRRAAGQSGRPQVRFPLPGVQSRGQHAVLEVGRHRADAHRHRSEGRHRAPAGAGPECRMTTARRRSSDVD